MNERLVYIEWIDSQGCTPSWVDISGYKPELPTHKSIGWVVHEDDISISFCGNIADETDTTLYQGNGIMTVPKIAITLTKNIDLVTALSFLAWLCACANPLAATLFTALLLLLFKSLLAMEAIFLFVCLFVFYLLFPYTNILIFKPFFKLYTM